MVSADRPLQGALALVGQALRQPRVYFVALFVGTVINLYGQIIVPYTRGTENVWARFFYELETYPLTAGASVAIAYLFPLLVGTFQTAATLHEQRRR